MLEAIKSPLKASASTSEAFAIATPSENPVEDTKMEEEGARLEGELEQTENKGGSVEHGVGDSAERRTAEKLDQRENGQLPTPSPSSNSTLSSAKPASSASSVKRSLSQSQSSRGGGERKTTRGADLNGEDESKGWDGKEYQLCGMYYSHGITPKNPSISAVTASTSTVRKPRKSTSTQNAYSWRTIEPSTSTLLPPPIHYGLMLLGEEPETYHKIDEESDEEESDSDEEDGDEDGPECGFKLPYDILRDHYYAEDAVIRGKGNENDEPDDVREKREKSRKPAHYRPIQTNYYVDRKPDRVDVAAVCMCKRPSNKDELGCLEECINRMMQYCCDPKLCPCGEQCSNIPLNKRETIPEGKDGLRVIWTGNRGFGLKTMVPIKKGELVIEYRGEIITRNESYRRVLEDYKDRSDYYFLEYDTCEVLDAGQRGNSARFINHSCGPNCEVVRWRLASIEEYQVGIFAKRDIRPGEELTYNYGWRNFVDLADENSEKPVSSKSSAAADLSATSKVAAEAANDIARQRCFCGSPLCSGYLGGKPKEENGGKGKGKETTKVARTPVKGKGQKEKKQEPVKLEWVQAKMIFSSTGRRIDPNEQDDDEATPKKKKFKASVSELGRSTSLRGAAARAKEKLTGQR
ncbi:hypothetical protein JCM5353_005909 [Sporobolomyces roseus]